MKELSNIMRFTSFTGQEEMNPNFAEGLKNPAKENDGAFQKISNTPTIEINSGGRIKGISNF